MAVDPGAGVVLVAAEGAAGLGVLAEDRLEEAARAEAGEMRAV